MSDPWRLLVLKSLSDTLETVSIDSGYQHDLAGRVFRGRILFGDDEPLPLISILEPPIPADPILAFNTNTASSGLWELLIQGFVKDDQLNPTDPAHLLMADVKKVLAAEKKRDRGYNILGMDGKVMELHMGQGSVRPADEMSVRAFFWLTLSLRVAEDLDNPFA